MQQNDQIFGQYPQTSEPHSTLGIISLALSVLTALSLCGFLVFAMVTADPRNPQDPILIFFGFCMIASPVLALVALGLGIGGLVQQGRNKLFGILGTALSAALLLCTGGFLLLGIVGAVATPGGF